MRAGWEPSKGSKEVEAGVAGEWWRVHCRRELVPLLLGKLARSGCRQ